MVSRSPRSLKAIASRALAAGAATFAVAAACAAASPASAPNGEDQARLDRTVRFLQEVQNGDGGFGGVRGGESDPDFSAWVALALAAASINPQDQARPGGVDVYTYVAAHAGELTFTTDFERALMVVVASGTSPRNFGGVDLIQAILARQLPDGSFPHAADGQAAVNDTVFAILALSPVPEAGAAEAVRRASAWLEGEQMPDGSWPSNCPRTVPGCAPNGEADMTAAAVEALNAAGRHDTRAQVAAFTFLHEVQNTDGGFPPKRMETESNVASTAWAVQAIWSAGQDPEAWVKASSDPLRYMASLQQPDGSIRWKASQDSLPVWMTAYVAPAFAGRALPIPAVPRSVRGAPQPPHGREAPRSGEAGQRGGGAIAGGGGGGAPLFSRPQPQSRGGVNGGERTLRAARGHAAVGASHAPTPAGPPTGDPKAGARNRSGRGSVSVARGAAAGGASGGEVGGVVIGSSNVSPASGAAGLHGAGDGSAAWASVAIAAAVALLAALGSVLERRRPELVL